MTARSPLAWRGVVEGFYGEPWSHADRLAWFDRAGALGLDHYVYAPKDDPWHREEWREPYPADRLASLASLAAAAEQRGVRFVYAISPGLSMRYDDPEEHRTLAAKCRQLLEAGIHSFALLFDDVPMDEPEALGRAHGETGARFERGFLRPAGIDEPVLLCPTDYAGVAATPYRTGLADALPADARLFWTGADIVVGEVTAEQIRLAVESYGRELVLWDNFPVNDFDRSRVFLGPLTGRATAPGLVGIAANPMVEAAASRFALHTVAEWAADPEAYEPAAAASRAYAEVAGPGEGLRTLVDACSAWPPGAPRWPRLDELVSHERWDAAEALLGRLADTHAEPGTAPDLAVQLAPWVAAARAAGAAGVLACRVLVADTGGPAVPDVDTLLAARRALEAEYADVARGAVLSLLDAALERLGVAPQRGRGDGALIAVLTGENPAPGDRELVEFLGASGFRAHLGDDPAADLLVVTRAAPEQLAASAAGRPVPLLAWGHLVPLGMASASTVPLSLDRIHIADADHPVAAGLDGEVVVYRGRSKLTIGDPPDAAAVVARDPESGRAVIGVTPAGATLADGSVAPAARATFFLAADGFAPWLVTPEARTLLLATVRTLLEPS
ncbi:beta-N-acetylglucosaminidase domain-containing protein [Leifsonia virtsii]|uniref:Beta-N-acetylglucosaminidase domain-containing protein n=1 Tax=Leifsonia virtsii TaxID=3035915 RepID=A0ABT8IYJ6_9MICO|nr:beta-N-acetylglucosaminidase domain-containing protein [Leifsonia virtsii]MDN4597878.1 beta-N-acetylglucosaminidase domain-containing protein [Leifsonia virtsii]